MSEQKELLNVKNLCVEFDTDEEVVYAVNGVSFSLNKGETLGLIGETGAGKTTIAKSILRILPDPPAIVKSGEIIFEGEDVLKISEKKMRTIRGKEISMIFQDPMTSLNPIMTVGQQIAETIEQHEKISKQEAKKKAAELLELVGIPGTRANEYPHQFSGGMKQRIVIAIALACKPTLLLADEPTTALDVTIQAQILDLIMGLNRQFGTSMILITHDMGIIAEFCDRVAVIYAGEIVETADVFELYDHPSHPYTKGLFGAIPSLNKRVERLNPIPGMMPDPTNLPTGCCFSPRCPYASEECKNKKPEAVDLGNGHIVSCSKAGKV